MGSRRGEKREKAVSVLPAVWSSGTIKVPPFPNSNSNSKSNNNSYSNNTRISNSKKIKLPVLAPRLEQ